MKYVLGIDIGTGSAKAVAVDLNSAPISVSQVHYPTNSPKPGYSEQDPEVIWDALKECLNDIVQSQGTAPAAICFSSAMHSLIAVDKENLPLAPMMTWADSRSDKIADRLKKSPQATEIYETSGMPLHAMSPLCKIIWLRENKAGIFRQTYKFISIKEYIWYKLFGEYVTDYSIAGATGMFDISELKWSPLLLRLAGIRENQLSDPVDTSYSSASHALELDNAFSETRFIVGSSDGCLANLGSYATNKGIAAITIGTSGAVRMASERPIFNHEAMTFSYYLDEHTFICGGPVNNGGNVLQWLMKDLLKRAVSKETFEELFEEVDQVPAGSEGLIFLPYIHGERAPIWDTRSSGAFIGIRANHNQGHFCRAVLEGVCYALYDVLLAVEDTGLVIDQINVSGGFVNSESWMQLLADISGRKLFLVQTEDASAMGAAFMALKALSLREGINQYSPESYNGRRIDPDYDKHKLYKQNFLIFKSLYSGLKDSMHKIHQNNC